MFEYWLDSCLHCLSTFCDSTLISYSGITQLLSKLYAQSFKATLLFRINFQNFQYAIWNTQAWIVGIRHSAWAEANAWTLPNSLMLLLSSAVTYPNSIFEHLNLLHVWPSVPLETPKEQQDWRSIHFSGPSGNLIPGTTPPSHPPTPSNMSSQPQIRMTRGLR